MASQSLYRKWRSQTFSDLVGQEPIVRTLCHAVRDGRLAHAYLFCGPRGTGKTSVARLLAKAVNCANPRDGEPCNECLSCHQITEGRSPDVFEIDAASNNGVDNIRELRENVNFLSTGGRYKVYIVDEVHMLSTQAFNALLKTLEEPPPHVIFVLATTEAHKVLPTIVSRCQRFDFRRFSRTVIVERLNHVAAGENLALEPAAADLLARAAQGGMRDALSLLDQAMAFCGHEITLAGVRGMLGLADAEAVRALVEHVAAGRPAEGLHLINELVGAGADLRQLNSQIAELWRALVLARAGANVAVMMDCGPEEAADYAALAGHFALDELAACARIFAANETPARGLPVPQLGLELSFLECLRIRQHGGALQSPQPVARASQAEASTERPRPAPPTPAPPMPRPEAASAPARNAARETEPAHEVEELDLAALDAEPLAFDGSSAAGAPEATPRAGVLAASGVPVEETPAAPVAVEATAATKATEATESPVGEGEPAGGNGDWLPYIQAKWELVKKVCKQKKRTVAALLHSARPIMVAPGNPLEIVLQTDYQFHLDKLRDPACRADVEWALEQVLEQPCHVRLVLAGQGGAEAAPGAGGPDGFGGGASGGPATSGPNGSNGYNGANGKGSAPAGPSTQPEASGGVTSHNGHNGHNAHNGTRAPRASGANGSFAGLTPLTPRTPDALANGHNDNGHNGHNGNGHASALSNGAVRDAALAYASEPGTRTLDALDAAETLEAEALADPMVQEFMKALPARLVEVRPLGGGSGS